MNRLPFRAITMASLLTASLSAHASVPLEQFSMNYEEVKVEYRPEPGSFLPFGFEVTVETTGQARTVLRPIRVHNVTLKRGVIASDALPAFTELALGVQGGTVIEPVAGTLTFVVPHGDPGSGTRAEISKVGTGTLVLSGSNIDAGATFELRFQPRPGTLLRGEPASWFRPGDRGELIATIRVPEPGKTLRAALRVTDGRSWLVLPVSVATEGATDTE